jgi:uncharacterized protein YkwD
LSVINYKSTVFSLWCLIACTAPAANIPEQLPDIGNDFTTEEVEILTLTNQERARHGLPPLKINRPLTRAARKHSTRMARYHRLSHIIKGKSFLHRLQKVGYPFVKAGENIARSKRSFPHIVSMWMKSPGHRQNILSPHFKEIGIGVSTASSGDQYVTQVFAAQK